MRVRSLAWPSSLGKPAIVLHILKQLPTRPLIKSQGRSHPLFGRILSLLVAISRSSRGDRTLVSQILVLAVVLFGGLALALALIFGGALHEHARARTVAEIRAIAGSAAQLLADGLDERSREIAVMARSRSLWSEGLDAPRVAALLERARLISSNSLWIGVADHRGIVMAATDNLLKGEDVSVRLWFRNGLAGPYVGDVHSAVLLEPHLPLPAGGDPLRFLDFAAPIEIDGRSAGVLAAHVSWDWARQVSERVLPTDASARGLELLIFDRSGELLYASAGRTASLRAVGNRLPSQGAVDGDKREPWAVQWSDGQEYLTTIAPPRTQSQIADLGWQVVVRAHGGKSAEPARDALAWAGAAGLAASLVLAAAAWFGVRRLGTDLQMLASAAERIGTSDARERIPLGRSSREVLTLSHALARMTDRLIDLQASLEEQVAARTAQLEAANTALEKLARRDALTGVLNRRGFEPKAQLLFDLALRGGRPLCLCLVDADHFKTVNDTYGHAVGDEVLKAIAGCLASRMRRTDLLARWGGEEFVLMLPDTSIDMASDLADALRKTIAAFEQLLPARVTVSIGLAQLKGTDESIAALLDRADRALYAAKNGGRDQVSTLASLL